MTFILIILSIIFIFAIGFVVVDKFTFLKKESMIERLSYSWGLGVGFIGFQLFLYSLLHITWNPLSLTLPWIPFFIPYIISLRKLPKLKIKFTLTTFEIFFVTLIILLFLFTGIESLIRPIQAWDGWVLWLLFSKVFYVQHIIDPRYLSYMQTDYPLTIPLMGTFGYIMMGEINDRYILLLFFLFYLALGGIFFSRTKKILGTKAALVLTFLLLSLQNIIRHGGRFEAGQADLALAFYIFAGTMLLVNFIKTKSKSIFVFLSIWIGISGLIKNDGLAFVLIANLIILFYIISWKKYTYVFFMFSSFIPLLTWIYYKKINHFPQNYFLNSGIHFNSNHIGGIVIAMTQEFFNIQNWNILWYIFFVTVVLCWKSRVKVKILLSVLFLQWLSYFAAFCITPFDPVQQIKSSVDRLYIHLAPLAVLIIGILSHTSLSFFEKLFIEKKRVKNKIKIKLQ